MKPPLEENQVRLYHAAAKTLIRSQRTMVLCTTAGGVPWAAPVYYVYAKEGFYFFSSPSARHTEGAGGVSSAAAAIFADSERWEEIQGVQMSGTLETVSRRSEQVKAIALFLAKFPFARPFLEAAASGGKAPPFLGDRVQLYVFKPAELFVLNNRLGFGQRVEVELTE